MLLDSSDKIFVSTSLAVANLGNEAVILDPNSGVYFGLNEVAARVLDLAQSGLTFGKIVDNLLEEYEVERDHLLTDVNTFIIDMEHRGFVSIDKFIL